MALRVRFSTTCSSSTVSTQADGMGMGLNICRTTIEFHGGTLTYANNPAGGTIFRFSLPAQTAGSIASA
jgi:signal transduction histidine kinase